LQGLWEIVQNINFHGGDSNAARRFLRDGPSSSTLSFKRSRTPNIFEAMPSTIQNKSRPAICHRFPRFVRKRYCFLSKVYIYLGLLLSCADTPDTQGFAVMLSKKDLGSSFAQGRERVVSWNQVQKNLCLQFQPQRCKRSRPSRKNCPDTEGFAVMLTKRDLLEKSWNLKLLQVRKRCVCEPQ
jgi:hypothetical protein